MDRCTNKIVFDLEQRIDKKEQGHTGAFCEYLSFVRNVLTIRLFEINLSELLEYKFFKFSAPCLNRNDTALKCFRQISLKP